MATPTKLSFSLQDTNGVRANSTLFASYDGAVETIDGLIGEWLAIGALIDAVTNAKIVQGHILIPLARDASWKSAPVAGNDVSDVLNLSFSNDDTINLSTFKFPNVKPSLLDAGGRPILTSGGAIDNLADALAGSFTNGYFVNDSGSDLIALVKAFQSDNTHRKQLSARSTVFG